MVSLNSGVDFGSDTIDGPSGFVSLDFEGNVRYARSVGAGVDAAVRRVGDAMLMRGFLQDPADPFELESPPPPGSTQDAFLAITALP